MPEEYSILMERCEKIKDRLDSINQKTIELSNKSDSFDNLVDGSVIVDVNRNVRVLEKELQETINGIIVLQALVALKKDDK